MFGINKNFQNLTESNFHLRVRVQYTNIMRFLTYYEKCCKKSPWHKDQAEPNTNITTIKLVSTEAYRCASRNTIWHLVMLIQSRVKVTVQLFQTCMFYSVLKDFSHIWTDFLFVLDLQARFITNAMKYCTQCCIDHWQWSMPWNLMLHAHDCQSRLIAMQHTST